MCNLIYYNPITSIKSVSYTHLAGDLSAASLAADEVEGYERVWGLRLLAAPSVAQMRRAIAGTSEGDAYGA